MQVIYKVRGEGKTEELLQLAAREGLTLVLVNRCECMRLRLRAVELNLIISNPITHWDFIEGRGMRRRFTGFLIDNVEILLQNLTLTPVVGISINKEKQDV